MTALHQIPYGVDLDASTRSKSARPDRERTQSLGLHWSVVESLPVHEAHPDRRRRSVANCSTITGIDPQSRRLRYPRRLLQFHAGDRLDAHAARLRPPRRRHGLALRCREYSPASIASCSSARAPKPIIAPAAGRARARNGSTARAESDRDTLLKNIMAGLPGAYDRFDIPGLRVILDRYRDVTPDVLKQNLARFLREVVPTAEEHGVRMCVHPDDPPRPLMGLPRVVSTADDIAFILGAVDSRANGLTFCSGSLGAHPKNDVPAIARNIRRPDSFRASAQRQERAERHLHGGRASRGRHRHGGARHAFCWPSRTGAKRKAAPTGAFRCGPITGTNCSTMSARPRIRAIRRSAA